MKIKPPSRKHLVKAKLKARGWEQDEEPRKQGRLSQLAKHNRRARNGKG